jgi:hypothetical protein
MEIPIERINEENPHGTNWKEVRRGNAPATTGIMGLPAYIFIEFVCDEKWECAYISFDDGATWVLGAN